MAADVQSYLYRIDADDQISFIDDSWLSFAAENDAPELVRDRLIGHPLWSYIGGKTIQSVYQALFDQVRVTRKPISAPFRCDSPSTIRQMELVVRPLNRGSLELEGRLLASAHREEVALFNRFVPRSGELLKVCSFCRRLALNEQWLEAADAVNRYSLFAQSRQPRLSEQMCPDCRDAFV
jgi:hypothetical protein